MSAGTLRVATALGSLVAPPRKPTKADLADISTWEGEADKAREVLPTLHGEEADAMFDYGLAALKVADAIRCYGRTSPQARAAIRRAETATTVLLAWFPELAE